MEVWRPVVGYEQWYEVSDLGRVRSLDRPPVSSRSKGRRGQILRLLSCGAGYVQVSLSVGGVARKALVHRLVAEAFHGPANGMEVDHVSNVKQDNRALNLRWISRAENMARTSDGSRIGSLGTRIVATHLETGGQVAFSSIREAARAGHDRSMIHRCLTGTASHHHGFTWSRT